MAQLISDQALVTFQDVAVYFSEDEWQHLEEWQKELYRTVMEEIHTALISLGYAILNPDTLFRIKKEKDVFLLDHRDSERAEGDGCLATASALLTPDILFRIKEDDESILVDHLDSEEGESVNNSSTCEPVASPDLLFQIKQEKDLRFTDNQDVEAEDDYGDHPTASSPESNPDLIVLIKPEEEPSPIDGFDAGARGTVKDPIIIHWEAD